MTAVPPGPAAPDVDTDTGALREAIRRLLFWGVDTGKADEAADAVLALPALRDLIAERDQAVAAVGRVEREIAGWHRLPDRTIAACGESIRRALDGDR